MFLISCFAYVYIFGGCGREYWLGRVNEGVKRTQLNHKHGRIWTVFYIKSLRVVGLVIIFFDFFDNLVESANVYLYL